MVRVQRDLLGGFSFSRDAAGASGALLPEAGAGEAGAELGSVEEDLL